jgi:hypothetical protein
MGVGIKVGSIIDEIGTSEFLHAFFSTISRHLEPKGWGSRFPELMTELYQGRLPADHVQNALRDLQVVREELSRFSPDKVVWDIEKPAMRPPWGKNISEHITSLANYFCTSTGRDLFEVLIECLEDARDNKEDVTVEDMGLFLGEDGVSVTFGVVPK